MKRFKRLYPFFLLVLLLCLSAVLVSCNECKEGHTHWEWRVEKAPTCTEKGLKSSPCTVCGEIITEEIEALGHKPNEQWITTKEASAKQPGEQVRYCTVCEEIAERKEIPANPYDKNGLLLDDLPRNLNYHGSTVTILHRNDYGAPEFEQKSVTGDNVRNAILDRNHQIEDRLNVELKFIDVTNSGVEYIKHIDAIYQANTQDYDIITAQSQTAGLLAIKGYLQSLSTIQLSHLDLSAPWWVNNLEQDGKIGSSLYFVTGDLSTNTVYSAQTLFINKDMFSRYNLTVPYDKVDGGNWTVDEMIALTANVYLYNWDESTSSSVNTRFGLTATNEALGALYSAAGMRILEADTASLIKISSDFTSQKASTLIGKLANWVNHDNMLVLPSDSTDVSRIQSEFKEGAALMTLQSIKFGQDNLLNTDFEYGILPLPKHDIQQTNYRTSLTDSYTLYGIFADFDDRRNNEVETLYMLTAVLECWSSEGYRLTTPEIFEVNLQLKYSQEQDETNMFEYIHDSIRLDLGQVYSSSLGGANSLISNAIVNNTDWSNSCNEYKISIEEQLNALLSSMRQ